MTKQPALIATRAEKRRHGKALRDGCPRAAQAEWKPRPKKQDPIKWLEESDKDRIPGLISVKYQRMAESAFKFFRGAAIIQARDLANARVSGIVVHACGDCHLANFGGFATPERKLVFDINDFDETFPAPWEWDTKRLGASLILAARDRGFTRSVADSALRAAAAAYREQMFRFADMRLLDVWYAQITLDDIAEYFKNDRDMSQRILAKKKQARARTSEAVVPKLTAVVGGRRRITDNPPVIYHVPLGAKELEKANKEHIEQYRKSLQPDRMALFDRYRYEDVAIKVVGVGSVGTRCYLSLFVADDNEPLFLQVKEARRSVLEAPRGKSRFAHQGYRVVYGQRLMQAASDIFLGWFSSAHGHDYYVRQFRDMKISAEIETFTPSTLVNYGTLCGMALARAHAKAGDAPSIAGYLGSTDRFDTALAKYSQAYADQAERDFALFQAAIRSGRLSTEPARAADLEFLL